MRSSATRLVLGIAAAALVVGIGSQFADALDVSVPGPKTLVSVNTVTGSAKLTTLQKGIGVAVGGGIDATLLSGELQIYYVDDPANEGLLSMPAPWNKKTARVAKYKNTAAPAGPSPVKVSILKAGKLTKVVARGVGGLDISTPPGPGGVVTVVSFDNANDASSYRFCSRYSLADGSTLTHLVTGAGFKLKLKGGVAIACPNCADSAQNGDETDVDCGGGSCAACGDGLDCSADSDCQSGVCSGNVCQAPSCMDGLQNGSETDDDCGGPCPDCGDGQSCQGNGDCQSGVCSGNVCQVPSCTDGVENGSETDEDCGGPCPDCADGQGCQGGGDCQSGVCTGNICQIPSCADGLQNGGETDQDCGGPCPDCGDGESCQGNNDCQSGICTGNVCQVPTCTDGVQNGGESDDDCGGPCPDCANGQSCQGNGDCQSGVCSGNTCLGPSCMDLVQNGGETGTDCGGPCAGCGTGGGCVDGDDCQSGVCTGNLCQAPSCMDGLENGSETDEDCGGSCPDCPNGDGCLIGGDCQSGVCIGNICQVPSCMDGAENGSETDVDCGGPCPACGNGAGCLDHPDCQSEVCVGQVCQAPNCADGTINGGETGLDCGGPSCPDCPPGQGCANGNDCQSGVCTGNLCQAPTCFDGVQNSDELGVDCGGLACPVCSCSTRGQCLMFVTSSLSGGNLGGLAGADAICAARANSAGLVGTYQAWLCDGTSSPATRSLHASVPYRRTDGALIANNWTDLTDGNIASPINRTESGADASGTSPFLPWTRVAANGTCDNETYLSPGSGPCPAFSNCPTNCSGSGGSSGWNSNSGLAQGSKGDINATNGNWTDGATGLCSTPAERIYCIEQ